MTANVTFCAGGADHSNQALSLAHQKTTTTRGAGGGIGVGGARQKLSLLRTAREDRSPTAKSRTRNNTQFDEKV